MLKPGVHLLFWSVERDSLLKAILTSELEEYELSGEDACHLFLRLLHIPLSQFELFIQVIFDSEVIGIKVEKPETLTSLRRDEIYSVNFRIPRRLPSQLKSA